ncbi:N-acetylneuraminate synthase family protein [Candidatus Pelagibacter ubique]|nr:N-acetylneuraminate synthase family protein [Candidatus Pelagibacter ubique]
MNYSKPVLIAEVGCNHKGDLGSAKEFIEVASSFCNLKYIKFQKRNPKSLLTKEEYNSPHPVPENSYGNTYGEHREYLEFNLKQHKELMNECSKKNMIYSSSVWDLISAKEISSLNPELIKVGSATNLDFEVLDYLCNNYNGKIHLSLGMTTKEEEEKIVNFFDKKERCQDLILYACTSAYPVETDDVCLMEIERMVKKYKDTKKIFDIGFSGHHKGIAFDIAAFTLGANYIERHFTLDRTWKGTDHAASLEPDGIRRLNKNLQSTFHALKYKDKDILKVEMTTRKKLKKEVNKPY